MVPLHVPTESLCTAERAAAGHQSTQAANSAMARQGGGLCPCAAAAARSGRAGAVSSAPAPPPRVRITYAYVRYLFICNKVKYVLVNTLSVTHYRTYVSLYT